MIAEAGHKTSTDFMKVRDDFPILKTKVNGFPLVYLDNAASSQKPQQVIDSISNYYSNFNANIHRGAHHLANLATEMFESVREKLALRIGASKHEVIFSSGTTDSINLVATVIGHSMINAGDEIILSEMEHHSNIVPWQMMAERQGAVIRVIPVLDNGTLDIDAYRKLLNEKTKVVSVVHISNSLGTLNPVKEMARMAHEYGALFMMDAAQSAAHMNLNVQDLDCDLMAFSAHKMCGPTGTGVLYGKEKWLEFFPPFRGGGEMIEQVSFRGTTFNTLPHKFEAGTPDIAGVIAFGAALDYLDSIGMETIAARENELHLMQEQRLLEIDGLRMIGTAKQKSSLSSFVIEGLHPFDIGSLIDQMGIAVRTGHHCTQPLMDRFKVNGTVRASLAFYNNEEDVERFIEALKKANSMLR